MGKEQEITKEMLVEHLRKIAFANAGDFAQVEEDGTGGFRVRLCPTERIAPEQRAALAMIKESRSGIEVRCKDSLRAIELLCRILGFLRPEKEEGQGRLSELIEGLQEPEDNPEEENGVEPDEAEESLQ